MMQKPMAAAARPSETVAGMTSAGLLATSSRNRYEAIVQTMTSADLAHITR